MFDVPINNDDVLDIDERFTLTIVDRTLPDGVELGNPGQAKLIISDDDGE